MQVTDFLTKTVFIGRFQPLHIGHRNVIEEYKGEFENFVVVIGSADKARTKENPLTAEEREGIIRECFPRVEIIHKDDHESDKKWAKKLEEKTEAELVISRNDNVNQPINEHTEMEVKEQKLYDPEIYSGTETRRRVRSGEEWRYLVPECAREKVSELLEKIKESGIQYSFEPGWKKENANHGTAE